MKPNPYGGATRVAGDRWKRTFDTPLKFRLAMVAVLMRRKKSTIAPRKKK